VDDDFEIEKGEPHKAHTNVRPAALPFRRHLRDHPGSVVLWLLPFGIAIQLTIDWVLGLSAEFFNAAYLLQAWGHLITSGTIPGGLQFITGQSALGVGPALAVGTTVFFVQPAIVLAVIIYPASRAIARFDPRLPGVEKAATW